ncbi:MAG: tetratricopeptide repeat protein [Saprospiraceae bacterium]
MNKLILNFIFLASIALLLSACDNKKPSSNTITEENSSTQQLGKTGVAAIDNLTDQIAQTPEDPKLYAARAEAFYNNEGYDYAIVDMAAAMKIDSTNADYHHLLSEIYLDYYKSRLALQTMKRCVALYPKRIPSLLKLAEIQQILKMYDASMMSIARIMKIEPDNPEGFFMIGLNHTLMGNKDASIKALQRCVELDPDHTDGWVLLGKIFAEDGNILAEQYFENAVLTSPENPDVLYNKASYLHNNDQLDKASSLLKKIIKVDPQYAEAFDRLGVIYLERDSADQAITNFNIAVNVNPEFGVAYYHRAVAFENKKNFEAAKADYERILKFNPDYENAKKGLERVTQATK